MQTKTNENISESNIKVFSNNAAINISLTNILLQRIMKNKSTEERLSSQKSCFKNYHNWTNKLKKIYINITRKLRKTVLWHDHGGDDVIRHNHCSDYAIWHSHRSDDAIRHSHCSNDAIRHNHCSHYVIHYNHCSNYVKLHNHCSDYVKRHNHCSDYVLYTFVVEPTLICFGKSPKYMKCLHVHEMQK